MRRTRSASAKQQNDQQQRDRSPAQGTQQRHLKNHSIPIVTAVQHLVRGGSAECQIPLTSNATATNSEAAAIEAAASEQVKPSNVGSEDDTAKFKAKKPSWDALSRYYSERGNSFPNYGDAKITMVRPQISGSFAPVNTMSKRKNAGNPSISIESDDRAKKRRRIPESPSNKVRQHKRPSPIIVEDEPPDEVPRDVTKLAKAFRSTSRIEVCLPARNEHVDLTQKTPEALTMSAEHRGPTRFGGKGDGAQRARPESVSSDSAEASSRAKEKGVVEVDDTDDLGDAFATVDNTQRGLVVSDVRRRGRKRLPTQPAFRHAGSARSHPERKRSGSESLDELQRPQSRTQNLVDMNKYDGNRDHRHSAVGSLKSNAYGSEETLSRKAVAPEGVLEVVRAASGRHSYDSRLPHTHKVFTQFPSASTNSSPLVAVSKREESLDQVRWMCLDSSKVLRLEYCPKHQRIFVLRSITNSQPAQLAIEFASEVSARPLEDFVKGLPRNVKRKEIDSKSARLRMDHAVSQARGHGRSEAASTNGDLHNTAIEGSMKRRTSPVSLSPEPKRQHHGQELTKKSTPSANADETNDLAGLETAANRFRRQTRSSVLNSDSPFAPNLTRDINEVRDEDRWTIMNPRWAERWHQSLVYPPTGRNRATVDADDIERLDEGEFLNDNLINFYLRYLQEQHKETLKKVYVFSTFFYEKLKLGKPGKINYEGVKSWTTKVDLFSYDYIVIPVNENAHWYLAIMSHPGELLATDVSASPSGLSTLGTRLSTVSLDGEPTRSVEEGNDDPSASGSVELLKSSPAPKYSGPLKCDPTKPHIVTLDSLGNSHISTAKSLRLYLAEEARHKKGIDLEKRPGGFSAKCMPLAQATSIPQQPNWCDCGIFLLGYMKRFIDDPTGVALNLLRKDKTVAHGWPEAFPDLRKEVRGLILILQEQQHALAQAAQEAKIRKKKLHNPAGTAEQSQSAATKDDEHGAEVTPRKDNRYTRYRVSEVIEDDLQPEKPSSRAASDGVASPTEPFVSALTSPAPEHATGPATLSSGSSDDVEVPARIPERRPESPDTVDNTVFIEPLATQSEESLQGKPGSPPLYSVGRGEEEEAHHAKNATAAPKPDQAPTRSPYFTPKPADETPPSHGESGAQYDGVETQQQTLSTRQAQ